MKWNKSACMLLGAAVLSGSLRAGSLTPVPAPSSSGLASRVKTWPMARMQSHLVANLEKHHQITASAAAALQADLGAIEAKFPLGQLSLADRKALHGALLQTMREIRAAVQQGK